jgi:hypothetical protein
MIEFPNILLNCRRRTHSWALHEKANRPIPLTNRGRQQRGHGLRCQPQSLRMAILRPTASGPTERSEPPGRPYARTWVNMPKRCGDSSRANARSRVEIGVYPQSVEAGGRRRLLASRRRINP